MKRKTRGEGRPLLLEPTGQAFRAEWIDFDRGIRVGNLQPHERITQILKYHLEQRHGTGFITDRWGRGMYWQWICWVSRANREAKPISRAVNFGCAKLFIGLDRQRRIFQSGLQVERGFTAAVSQYPGNRLQEDWDWHRLLAECRAGSALEGELRRLIHEEGFVVEIGDFDRPAVFDAAGFSSADQLREAAAGLPAERWAGFQLYYPMPEREVRSCSGHDLIRAVLAVFAQVVPAMNRCLQVPLAMAAAAGPGVGRSRGRSGSAPAAGRGGESPASG